MRRHDLQDAARSMLRYLSLYPLLRSNVLTVAEFIGQESYSCPRCGGPVRSEPLWVRAGMSNFVPAIVCDKCRMMFGPKDTMSIEREEG